MKFALTRRLTRAAVAGALAAGVMVAAPSAAKADLGNPVALPTVQIDGVVWSQVVVGNTVYATGKFANARPAGAAPGTNLTPRSNILAYNITTGALIDSWAPALNAQGTAITASPDGSTIYVGGDFTDVSGVPRSRLVALSASTGAVVTTFQADTNGRVSALAVDGSTLYVGGSFSTLKKTPRTRAGAVTLSGALLGWAPQPDTSVKALTVAPRGAGKQVILGGSFSTINGVPNLGMGSVDAVTGAVNSWPINKIIVSGGDKRLGISSLSTDGTSIYGTGINYWAYAPGRLENAFRADLNGNLVWVSGCRGDQHSAYPNAEYVYTVGHAHDCSFIGGFPEDPAPGANRALALTKAVAGVNVASVDLLGRPVPGDFLGYPAPQQVPGFLPQISQGTFTGQNQGAWHVTGNANYLAYGGEFPSVAGRGQQGLTRFAIGTPVNNALATDNFSRNVSAGWGIAPVGGSWVGTGANTSVANGVGAVQLTPGTSTTARLLTNKALDTQVTAAIGAVQLPTATSYVSLLARRSASSDYRVQVQVTPDGTLSLAPTKVINSGAQQLLTPRVNSGVKIAAGGWFRVRLSTTGSNPTTIQARIWPDGTTEPTTWQVSATDSAPENQAAGGVGFAAFLSAAATQPWTVAVEDFQATKG